MNNSFKANVKSPKLESSSKKKHQLVNPLLFRLDTIPSQSEVEPSDDDAEDIMRCSLLCVAILLHTRLRAPLIFRKTNHPIPIIQPTSLLLQNSGICQPPPAKETENLRKKMKNKTMKDKTMCGQAPADQPTAIPDICHGRHGHTRVDFFWLV